MCLSFAHLSSDSFLALPLFCSALSHRDNGPCNLRFSGFYVSQLPSEPSWWRPQEGDGRTEGRERPQCLSSSLFALGDPRSSMSSPWLLLSQAALFPRRSFCQASPEALQLPPRSPGCQALATDLLLFSVYPFPVLLISGMPHHPIGFSVLPPPIKPIPYTKPSPSSPTHTTIWNSLSSPNWSNS